MPERKTGIMWDFRMGLRLMRYSVNFKLNMAVSVVFILLGVVMSVVDMERTYFEGVYFLMGPMLAAQMITILNVSDMVNSSPLSKKMQLGIPVFVNMIGILAGYTLLLVIAMVRGLLKGMRFAEMMELGQIQAAIFMAVLGFVYLIYFAFAYKYSVASMIGFLAAYIVLFGLMTEGMMDKVRDNLRMPVPVMIVFGYGLIIAGSALCYFFSKRIYRKEFSKRMLKLAMQEVK